jgi:hypothetical protein
VRTFEGVGVTVRCADSSTAIVQFEDAQNGFNLELYGIRSIGASVTPINFIGGAFADGGTGVTFDVMARNRNVGRVVHVTVHSGGGTAGCPYLGMFQVAG